MSEGVGDGDAGCGAAEVAGASTDGEADVAGAAEVEELVGAMPARKPAAAANANGMPITTAIADPRMKGLPVASAGAGVFREYLRSRVEGALERVGYATTSSTGMDESAPRPSGVGVAPRSTRTAPSAATIAPLSVHKRAGGMRTHSPSAR